jgi:hypothetical protein
MAIRIHVASAATRPFHVGFVVDTSGSMEGGRLASVKRTLHAAKDLFRPTDRVTLVTFNSVATIVCAAQVMDEAGMASFYTAVDAIRVDGLTNLSLGLSAIAGVPAMDGLVVLTDGQINEGIQTTVGLTDLVARLGPIQMTAFGYGPDHSAELLNTLAVQRRGAYQYIKNDELLPLAVGDLIGGLRTEVLRSAVLTVPRGWACRELDADRVTPEIYRLGNLVANRDYWVVFAAAEDQEEPTATLTATGGFECLLEMIPISDCIDLQEQVFRCRAVSVISAATASLRQGRGITEEATALLAEYQDTYEALRSRPLMVGLAAQLVDVIHQSTQPPSPDAMARMTSGAAYYSSQRGVSEDPTVSFSSPAQVRSATQTQRSYSSDPSV